MRGEIYRSDNCEYRNTMSRIYRVNDTYKNNEWYDAEQGSIA